MKTQIEAFLADLDECLVPHANGDRLTICHIGRSSLVWQYGFTSTTSDIDMIGVDGALADLAISLFGKGSEKAREHGLYLDIVNAGLPPVPHGHMRRATKRDGPWKVIEVHHLEPNDLAATKLKRFSAKDREDIRLLCDAGMIDEERLQESFENAFIWTMEKDGDPIRDRAAANLRTVKQYLRGEIKEF
jgi:hypothetical protein